MKSNLRLLAFGTSWRGIKLQLPHDSALTPYPRLLVGNHNHNNNHDDSSVTLVTERTPHLPSICLDEFLPKDANEKMDIILLEMTTDFGLETLLRRLRYKFPNALLVLVQLSNWQRHILRANDEHTTFADWIRRTHPRAERDEWFDILMEDTDPADWRWEGPFTTMPSVMEWRDRLVERYGLRLWELRPESYYQGHGGEEADLRVALEESWGWFESTTNGLELTALGHELVAEELVGELFLLLRGRHRHHLGRADGERDAMMGSFLSPHYDTCSLFHPAKANSTSASTNGLVLDSSSSTAASVTFQLRNPSPDNVQGLFLRYVATGASVDVSITEVEEWNKNNGNGNDNDNNSENLQQQQQQQRLDRSFRIDTSTDFATPIFPMKTIRVALLPSMMLVEVRLAGVPGEEPFRLTGIMIGNHTEHPVEFL